MRPLSARPFRIDHAERSEASLASQRGTTRCATLLWRDRGTQLGYQQAEEWQQLRVTNMLHPYQRQVAAVVHDYLHGRHED